MTGRTVARHASPAFAFVIAIGVVNLFGDMTYEGGSAINGPFLGSLGASAAAISILAGGGEFLGFSLRAVSGHIADKSGRYWLVTIIGYGVNLFVVPAMALAGNWKVAGALVLAERVGRAIRKPSVDAMLSYSAGKLGRGWVYSTNTALDEIGGTLGPLLVARALFVTGSFRTSYSLLLISAVLAIAALTVARVKFPVPPKIERADARLALTEGFTRKYWLHMVAAACFAAGLMSFEFISFHMSTHGTANLEWIPVFLAISSGIGIPANLLLGRLYDRSGLAVLLAAVFVSALFSPLVFFGGFGAALAGIVLWGVGNATQDTVIKSLVAGMIPKGRRNLAFGMFYLGYGGGWLVGSVVMGIMYAHSVTAVVVFAVASQLVSIPLFVLAERSEPQRRTLTVS